MHASAQASNRLAKADRASHGPRVGAKARVQKTMKNPRENLKEPKLRTKVPEASIHKGKSSKTGLSGLENPKSEASSETQESAQTFTTNTSWNDGLNGDEWNDDWSSVGLHEGWEQTYDTSASIFTWRFGSLYHK